MNSVALPYLATSMYWTIVRDFGIILLVWIAIAHYFHCLHYSWTGVRGRSTEIIDIIPTIQWHVDFAISRM